MSANLTIELTEPLVQTLLRIPRWRQQSTKPSAGPSKSGALCDCNCMGHTPTKLALDAMHLNDNE